MPTPPPIDASAVWPSRLVRAVLTGMSTVVGGFGTQATLEAAGLVAWANRPPDDDDAVPATALAGLCIALEQMYGVRGGRGVALHVGRLAFVAGLAHVGGLPAASSAAFKALPSGARLKAALVALGGAFEAACAMPTTVADAPNALRLSVKHSAPALGRTSDKPVCALVNGLIHGCAVWATDADYAIQEVACIASGAPACVFMVNKMPLLR